MNEQKIKELKPQKRRMTIEELLELWEIEIESKLKKSTQSTYIRVADTHIVPVLGKLRVTDLNKRMLNEFIGEKMSEYDLSSSTVCSIVTVLNSIVGYATALGFDLNINGKLSRPKVITTKAETFSKEEQTKLITFLTDVTTYDNLGVLVCIYTGMRIGEICALKWKDISLDKGLITVKRTIQRIKNSDYQGDGEKTVVVFGAPKSRSSNRTIPIPQFLTDILKERRCEGECFLLTGSRVRYMEPRTYQNRFKLILKRSGIGKKNFHALRHTFATNCIELGFDPKMLSQILGHSDVSVTLNTYVHPSAERMRNYMELLGSNFVQSRG